MKRTALVTGASGYVGGRLVPRLLEEGWDVRVLTRRALSIAGEDWAGRVQVVEGDAGDETEGEASHGRSSSSTSR